MMRQMRENTKWIMLLAILAFGGLMFFEWGMDITGQTSGGFGEIGSVNGAPVAYEQYMAAYRNIYDAVQASQEEPVTNAQNRELEDQAWNEIVNAILVGQELRRRGIVVTDDEIVAAARSFPPPGLESNAAFVTDGQFDMTKYQRFLATADREVLLQFEAYYRDAIPRGKLFRQVGRGMHVSDGKLWRDYKDANEKATVRYVSFDPLVRIADDQIEVADDEVARHYAENREDFATPATAQIVSVALSKTPTQEDTAAVFQRASDVLEALRGGEDFGDLARRESGDPGSAELGGDLGVFPKGRMTGPFDSAIFATRLNRVAGPVKTEFGLHLLEVTERWGQDSAQARHVLLPFERTDESEIAMLAVADSLEALGEIMPLGEAAVALGLSADTLEIIETRPLVPGAGPIAEGGEWAFEPETQAGDVSPVFENRASFYSIELVSVDPAGYVAPEDAEPAIRQTLGLRKKLALALDEARLAVQDVRGGRPLAEVAVEAGLEVREAGPFARNDFVPGLGYRTAAVGAAFGIGVDEISDPLESNQNVFLLERIGWDAADSAAWVAQVGAQRLQTVAGLRNARLDQWLAALRDAADIVDRREEVLAAPDEEAASPGLPPVF